MNFNEKLELAQKLLSATFTFTTVDINNWKNERVYVNRPNESKQYQSVGYVRVSDGATFPAFGTKCRTERDRDAKKMLDCVSDVIMGRVTEIEEKPFTPFFIKL